MARIQTSSKDYTLFFSHNDGKITIIVIYVDGIILAGDDMVDMARLKIFFVAEFEIKDPGSLRFFQGMEVARNNTGISVYQR